MVIIVPFELALFSIAGFIFVCLVLTIMFSVITALCALVRLPIDYGDADAPTRAAYTMIIWAIFLVVGGVCSYSNNSSLWNNSPFGYIQGLFWTPIKHWLEPADTRWRYHPSDYSGMWATFWSYCISSLLISMITVLILTTYEALRDKSRHTAA